MKKRRSSVSFGRASKESLALFLPLYKWLRRRGYRREEILFGVEGSEEFTILYNNRVFFYDFFIRPLKLIVEFHGTKFHARTENDTLLFGHSARSVMEKDRIKLEAAKKNGFELLVVWSDADDSLSRIKALVSEIENYGKD